MSCYQELYVNIVQCHVQADLMHTLSFYCTKETRRGVPTPLFLFRETQTQPKAFFNKLKCSSDRFLLFHSFWAKERQLSECARPSPPHPIPSPQLADRPLHLQVQLHPVISVRRGTTLGVNFTNRKCGCLQNTSLWLATDDFRYLNETR